MYEVEPGNVPIKTIAELRLQIRRRRVDANVAANRLPAEQHPVSHGLSVGERDLDGPGALADGDMGGNDGAHLALTIRADDLPPIDLWRRAINDDIRAARNWMNPEADHGRFCRAERLDLEGMESRRACARVDLGLDGRKAEFGPRYPFDPPKCERLPSHASPTSPRCRD